MTTIKITEITKKRQKALLGVETKGGNPYEGIIYIPLRDKFRIVVDGHVMFNLYNTIEDAQHARAHLLPEKKQSREDKRAAYYADHAAYAARVAAREAKQEGAA